MTVVSSPTDRKIAYSFKADNTGLFYVWDLEKDTVRQYRQYLKDPDERGTITSMSFTPDGKALLTGSQNYLASLVYLEGPNQYEDYRSSASSKMPRTNKITSVDVNEEYVVIGNNDETLDSLKLNWNKNHFALVRKRNDRKNSFIKLDHKDKSGVNVVKFLPGRDSLLLTGCDDGNVYIWDFKGGAPNIVDTLSGHSSPISSCAVSEEDSSRFIIIGSKDNTANLWIWDADAKIPQYTTSGVLFEDLIGTHNTYAWQASDITSVDFINKIEIKIDTLEDKNVKIDTISIGKILTASADGTVKLWELRNASGTRVVEVPTIIRHSGAIRGARFSHDGHYIITGGDDGLVKAWNIAAGAEQKIEELRQRKPVLIKK
jgi:WD40 repeat protein